MWVPDLPNSKQKNKATEEKQNKEMGKLKQRLDSL